jgi:hypothetical protein
VPERSFLAEALFHVLADPLSGAIISGLMIYLSKDIM